MIGLLLALFSFLLPASDPRPSCSGYVPIRGEVADNWQEIGINAMYTVMGFIEGEPNIRFTPWEDDE